MEDRGLPGRNVARIVSFKLCDRSAVCALSRDTSSLCNDDELAMLTLQSTADIVDKLIHGMVAFISTLGFEMLVGSLRPNGNCVTVSGNSMMFMDECNIPAILGADLQVFTAYFKRPAPKTHRITNIPIPEILQSLHGQCERIVSSRSCDWECCLCSEDLVGIKQLTLIDDSASLEIPKLFPLDWPISSYDRRCLIRLSSQPLQGYGHRPPKQRVRPIRYKLVIIGINQSGVLTFVHNMLMISGFRIVTAEIDTIRGGSYAHNTYVIETYSDASERLLRANFQCVVPIRYTGISTDSDSSTPPFFKSLPSHIPSTPCGIWTQDDGKSAYFGTLMSDKGFQRHGFGRFWEANDKTSLSSYSYEGEWVNDTQEGFGFELKDDGNCVSYSFGKFFAGKLIDGCILFPFEPPMRSVRVVPHHKPNICVYKVLIHRAEYWVRQLPKWERPIPFLSASKIPSEYACTLRSSWTAFAESPIPCTASMGACQVAALLEVCGLHKAAKIAFAKRIDGGLLEAMTEEQSIDILLLRSESERNMVSQFFRTMAKAYNIDRHMRQPTSVLDALYNPSVGGKFFPLDKMRVVDNLGEGAYGKVIYAEYQNTEEMKNSENVGISRMSSSNSLVSRMIESSKSPMSQPSLISALTARRGLLNRTPLKESTSKFPNTYLALKEQIGAGAELEKSCELVREWATLNALPHENIVKLEGICADTNAPKFNKRYLATALIEASLPSLIYRDPYSQAPELTPLLTIQLAGDIASGLAHMHSLNILHGDIKSPNILVDLRASNRPIGRICDFGHAAIRIGPRPQRRMCTFGWASPESLRDAETDLSADVWSWAVVVWEMYVKEIPWKGCSHPQMLAAVGFCGLDPSGFMGQGFPNRVDAERKISALCMKCFRVNPAKRPRMNRVLETVDKLSRVSARTAFNHMHSLLQ
jgi:serine/threonine protein kinase